MTKILKNLQFIMGSGGTSKNGVIQLQGNHVKLTMEHLFKEGYRPKEIDG